MDASRNLLTEREQRADFDRVANSYESWFHKARALRFSANHLFKIYRDAYKRMFAKKSGSVPIGFFVAEQALLLQGFAVECALKGLYVANVREIASGGTMKLKTHDLLSLCNKVQIELNYNETEALRLLSLMITSYGRYPVTVKFSDNARKKTMKEGLSPLYRWSWDDFFQVDHFIRGIVGEPVTDLESWDSARSWED